MDDSNRHHSSEDGSAATSSANPSHALEGTTRPDTAASVDEQLPEFYPEGDGYDEDDYDDGESVSGVFAFTRPVTNAPPHVVTRDFALHDANKSTLSPDSKANENDLSVEPVLSYDGSRDASQHGVMGIDRGVLSPVAEAGQQDVGGHTSSASFDPAHPQPFSGYENLNSSPFLRSIRQRSAQSSQYRPNTGRSLNILRRRKMTGSTSNDVISASSRENLAHARDPTKSTDSFGGSMREGHEEASRGISSRSGAPTMDTYENTTAHGTDGRDARGTSGRTRRRDSFGMTELSGDPTQPEGFTTWGDGDGRILQRQGDFMAEMEVTEDDSPYAEVRASVSNIDDPDMPAWLLGALICIITSASNTFFYFRTPAPYISPFIVIMVAFPLGKLAALVMPYTVLKLPKWLGGFEIDLNPGPFNIKEHAIILMMANVGTAPGYSLGSITASEKWYHRDFGVGFSLLFLLSTQITGFSFAGLSRRFVIYPASMIWPGVAATATVLNTLHAEDDPIYRGMNRSRMLKVVIIGAFAYHFLPALSVFSWACWIAPSNRTINTLFGVGSGLGFGIFSFDWTQISWIGAPLATPWWASMNIGIGFVAFYWILAPIMYYCNVWYTAYLPISSPTAFDRFGDYYNVTNILNADLSFNETAYQAYSPVYLTATYNVTYCLLFALSTAALVHTALYHGRRIYLAIVNVSVEPDDVHMKLMRHYPEAPDWWYLVLFVLCFIVGIIAIEVFHTGLPVWGLVLALLMPLIYFLPAALIFAMTSQQIAINLLSELIPGYLFPGHAFSVMVFKTYSVNSLITGLLFVEDQKMGHYMKVPPRATFICQLSAAFIGGAVQIATKVLLFKLVPDICSDDQKDLLTCSTSKSFFSASILWGVIGPARIFGEGMYTPQFFALLIGAALPVPLWLWVRKRPNSIFRNISMPIILNGGTWIPPATGINYASFMIVAFIFQYWLRRRHFTWWSKYNYVIAAALDVGTTTCVLLLFFAIGLSNVTLNWWGNTVYEDTVDYTMVNVSHLAMPDKGWFGLTTW